MNGGQSVHLRNVLIEDGFVELDDHGLRGTRTRPASLRIVDGVIVEVGPVELPADDGAILIEAKGRLVLPSLYEWHTHLDKTWASGPWRSCRPWTGIHDRIEEEKSLLPEWMPLMAERAKGVLEHQLRVGVTHVRTHANLDPIVGLRAIEATYEAAAAYDGRMDVQVVAFPQHGFVTQELKPLMAEALATFGAIVGGIDPAGVDGDIEQALGDIYELAAAHDADIDIHVHDPDRLGLFQVQRIVARTIEIGWHGRTTISHAYCLADLGHAIVRDTAQMLADAGVAVASCADLDRTIALPELMAAGVDVRLGSDGIMTTWQPLATGDILERVNLMAERFAWVDEASLARSLGLATGGRATVGESGTLWPRAGDEASLMLVRASCSAEAVARRPESEVVLFRGRQVV
jgi:cytosine/adenosine deaminase-related metal-dependent hydrolase